MTETKSYISTDSHGVMRVAGTRISLDSIVIGFQQGQSPEELQRNFPSLTLEHVYGAIAHYLGCREEVDEYLQRQQSRWGKLRSQSEQRPSDVVERLRQQRIKATRRVG